MNPYSVSHLYAVECMERTISYHRVAMKVRTRKLYPLPMRQKKVCKYLHLQTFFLVVKDELTSFILSNAMSLMTYWSMCYLRNYYITTV